MTNNINNLLIIRPVVRCSQEVLDKLHKTLIKQMETGTVVIPPWCEIMSVPKGVEIRHCVYDYDE